MTEWKRREDNVRHGAAHGIRFVMYERATEATGGEIADGPYKKNVKGKVSMTLACNQWMYGDELIAQIFCRDAFSSTSRVSNGWSRVQVYLGKADLETADMLETLAGEIRNTLEGKGEVEP
jgi:hypothetical protein